MCQFEFSMKHLQDTLNTLEKLEKLHSTLCALAPLQEREVDANLTEQNSFSRMIELGRYFDSLHVKPFTVSRCDQTAFIGRIPILLHGRHTADMDFTVRHTGNGYRVDFDFYGVISVTYQNLNAQQLFARITAQSNEIFRQWREFVNVY